MVRSLSISLAALLLGACAMPPVKGVSTEADVVAFFGKPIDTRQIEGGARQFDYPRGPLGRETWRITLSADGKVQWVEQLLDEAHFARIKSGMSKIDVQRELGRHFITTNFANLGEQVWSWRYTDFGSRYMFFNTHFDAQTGLLKYASRTPEFVSELRLHGRR